MKPALKSILWISLGFFCLAVLESCQQSRDGESNAAKQTARSSKTNNSDVRFIQPGRLENEKAPEEDEGTKGSLSSPENITLTLEEQEYWSSLSLDKLIIKLRSSNRDFRVRAAKTLQTREQEAVPLLIENLTHSDMRVRYWSAYVLGTNRVEQAVRPLIEALPDKNRYARKKIGLALKQIDTLKANEAVASEAVYYANKGIRRAKKGNYSEAVWFLDAAILFDSNNALALSFLADTYKKLGELEKAAAALRKGVENNPQDVAAHINLGYAYNRLGESEKAVRILKKAMRLDPKIASIYGHLGDAYMAIGKTEVAVHAYKKQLRLKPNNAIAHNNLGVAYEQLGIMHEAISEYKKAAELDPENAELSANLDKILQLQQHSVKEELPNISDHITPE